MSIHKGLLAFAQRLREAMDLELSHGDVCRSLSDALNDLYPGRYCYVCDVFGDDSSGDVVYTMGGDTYRAPYEIGLANGKRTTSIDTDQAINVLPRTVYDEEADEDDHYAGMSEAKLAEAVAAGELVERFPGSAKWKRPLTERFISKAERDAADSGDFAGKGKSFPILKPGDVKAAVRSMGRAGSDNKSMSALKSSIIRIAKKKGWTKYLPKSWQTGDGGGDTEESDMSTGEAKEAEFIGDIIPLKEGAVGQDGTAYLKLIAPGWGSSGYYSSEVLKRDGASAFPAGTKNFWNHQTATEEAERPEGSLRDFASVLTEDAHYEDPGPAGAGLYAKARVNEEFRKPVDDLAKHIGMSIRAMGKAKEGEAEGKRGNIIEKLTRGISVDYVTTPGAGGKVLQLFEAARMRPISAQESGDMTKEEVQAMISESQKPLVAENKRLRDQVSLLVGPSAVREGLRDILLPAVSKERIVKRLSEAGVPLTEAGAVDQEKLGKLLETEATAEAQFLEQLGYGRIEGLGAKAPAVDTKEAEKRADEEYVESLDSLANIFCGEGKENKKLRKAFKAGRAA